MKNRKYVQICLNVSPEQHETFVQALERDGHKTATNPKTAISDYLRGVISRDLGVDLTPNRGGDRRDKSIE